MPQRSSKRIYKQSAVESWFERLAVDWEGFFSELPLEHGQAYYRECVISEVELAAEDAIVHAKLDGQACYVVVEWDGKQLRVRGSMTDNLTAQALGVAGMYEIEELVAEEAALGPPVKEEGAPTNGVTPGASPKPPTEANGSEEGPQKSRPLLLKLSASSRGLRLRGFWQGPGKARPRIFKGDDTASAARSDQERESLLCLAGHCRRSQFRYQQRSGDYTLSQPAAIAGFFERDLARWTNKFNLELDAAARRLKRGAQKARVKAYAKPALNGNMRLDWLVEAGGTKLDAKEARQLLMRGGELALIPRVGLVRMDREQAQTLEDIFPIIDNQEGASPPRYLLFSLFDQNRVTIDLSEELQAWRKSFTEAAPALVLPRFLRPYQKDGARWLARLCELGCHGLLADEMGLGKTIQTLALLHARPVAGLSSLIVCPASVVPVWAEEIRRFFPELRCRMLSAKAVPVEGEQPVLWISSYAQLRRQRQCLDTLQFGYAILDEAQQIKNPDAKVTQACLRIRARHRIALTGTPLENRPLDLWTIFRFLMPGLLGSRRRFEEAESSEESEALTAKLKRQTQPFILRRRKEAVVQELPPKIEMDLACPLTPSQRQEYEKIAREGLRSLGNDLDGALKTRSMSLFTLLTRLRQASCDPGLLPWSDADPKHSGKVGALLPRIEEARNNGKKVVVFSQFTSFLDRLESTVACAFPELPIFKLQGKTVDRATPVDAFQNAEGAAAIFVSLRAGGTGITLHAADYLFLMDPWWNPAVEAQAVDRVHRIGQKRRVFIYRLVATGTVEDRINRLKAEKRAIFDRIVSGSGPGAEITEAFAGLESLINLRGENSNA